MSINKSNYEQAFTDVLEDSGMPVTEDSIKAAFQAEADKQGFIIRNNSAFSGFWRVITALVSTAVLWLVTILVTVVMPNSFVMLASDVFLDLIATGLNLLRKDAIKAQGNITFSRTVADEALVIPAGTVINSTAINGVIHQVKTISEATLSISVTSLDILCEALIEGSKPNLAGGYYTVADQPLDGIDDITNADDWLVQHGAAEESDEALQLRCQNQFNTVGNWHTDASYRAIITSFAGIDIDQVFFTKEAPRGPGTADAYILWPTGEPAAALLSSIQDHIMVDGNHGHGDDMQVLAMPALPQTITADAQFYSTVQLSEKSQLLIDIEQFIRAGFRENSEFIPTLTHPYTTFSFSRLAAELMAYFPELEHVEFSQDKINHDLNVSRLTSLTVAEL